MRSSTLALLVTVLLSLHVTAAWNLRRYPPSSIEALPSTLYSAASPSASPEVNRNHGDEAHEEGKDYGAQPTASAASDENFAPTTFSFIPSSTTPGVAPTFTEPTVEEVESSILASAGASSTEAARSEAAPSKAPSSLTSESPALIPTSSEVLPSSTPSNTAALTDMPTGTPAIEDESSTITPTSTLVPSAALVAEEKGSISTSNNANVGASASKSVGEDGQCTQLSFVPTTVFATGEAPTVTVTEAPRTVTQVEIKTAPQESCETPAASTITLQASSVQAAQSLTITVTASQEKAASAEQTTITVTASRESCSAPPASTITLEASAPVLASAPALSLEPITITSIQRESCETPAASSELALAPNSAASEQVTITQILTASEEALLEQVTITQTVLASQEAPLEPITITVLQTASAEAVPLLSCEPPSTITLGTDIAAYGALEPVTITQVVTETVSADASPATITSFKNIVAEATPQSAQVVTVFVTKAGGVLPAQTITIIPDGVEEINAGPAAPMVNSLIEQNQNNQLEYAKTTAGFGSVGPDGRCRCACPCAPDAFPSTTFPFISVTTTKSFDAPASEEPTTTLVETRSTFQTIVISGTFTAEDAAPTEEPIVLDTSPVPIILESTLFSTPVISSIPMASFGVGDTTFAPGSSPTAPTATSSAISEVDRSIVFDKSTIASSTALTTTTAASLEEAPAFTTTLDAPLDAPEIGAIPKSQAADGASASESVVGTSIVLDTTTSIALETSTLASFTAFITAPASPLQIESPVGEVPVFITTLDAPLETPEIGAIPKDAAPSESVVNTSIALDTPTSIVLETSTTAESTKFVTTTAAPSPVESPAGEAPVFTTTLDAPLETPELGAIPKSDTTGGGEFFELPAEPSTPVESVVPSQTAAQAEAEVTPAPGGEVGEDDISNYNLSSAIVLGNLGGRQNGNV